MSDTGKTIGDLIRKAWANDDPTGWFDAVYANALNGQGFIPWAYMQPNPEMVSWLDAEHIDGSGKTALVIGCGLGDDAEELARRGFDVTAFDIAETAIGWCKERFPESRVSYLVADLFKTPDSWRGAFDLVFESRTIQSLPVALCEAAIEQIASFVAPGGRLVVICHGRDAHEEARGIPWPLSREELSLFEQYDLIETDFRDYSKNGLRRFIVHYRSNHSD